MRKTLFFLIIMAVIFALLTGCGNKKQRENESDDPDLMSPSSSSFLTELEASNFGGELLVTIYLANEDDTKLLKVMRSISVGEARKSTEKLATAIVELIIAGPLENENARGTIPEGASLKNPVKVDEGTATVNFTNEFINKHPGGKLKEQMTIFSIVNSLTELIDVQRVQFKINGKIEKEYRGSFMLDAPFPRTPSLIEDEETKETAGVLEEESIDYFEILE